MRNLILNFKDAPDCRLDLEIKTFNKEHLEKTISVGTIQNLGLIAKSNEQIVSDSLWVSIKDLDLMDPK